MTCEKALSYLARIKLTAIGNLIKVRLIEYLSMPHRLGANDRFHEPAYSERGRSALIEFYSLGKSLSVYGVLVNKKYDVPKWEMTILDNWELTISN